MRSHRARIDRLQRRLPDDHEADYRDQMQANQFALLEALPDLALVEACDTTPEVFAHIERGRAMARGDWETVQRLEAEYPEPRLPERPPEIADDLLKYAAWCLEKGSEESDRMSIAEDAAMRAARARLGLPPVEEEERL